MDFNKKKPKEDAENDRAVIYSWKLTDSEEQFLGAQRVTKV